MKLKFSPNDHIAIAEYIALTGGIQDPTSDELEEILDAIDNLNQVTELVFVEDRT